MIQGRIVGYDGRVMTIEAPLDEYWELERRRITSVEIELMDGRGISPDQRRKAYALIKDIADYTGYPPDEAKQVMKYLYLSRKGVDYFSLSDCDMNRARDFITFMIDFCLEHGVPCLDSLLDRAEDIGAYLYRCLVHRVCCVCNGPAEIHHVDRIGIGGSRDRMSHIGYEAMALCRSHHDEAHSMSRHEFNDKYHIYGIKLDEYLVKLHKLGRMDNA